MALFPATVNMAPYSLATQGVAHVSVTTGSLEMQSIKFHPGYDLELVFQVL